MNIENAELNDIIAGISLEGESYRCLYCGEIFELGEIFRIDDRFFDAQRAAAMHVERMHPNLLQEMMEHSGKYLTLTDNQRELFLLFSSGLSDGDIAKKLGVSPSTVRHQRFTFREKAKAAKMYLAAWSMVSQNKNRRAELLPIHRGATMVDERYVITEEENQKILENIFISLNPLRLKMLSPKEKKKIVILRKIAEQFDPQKKYSEKEVNALLEDIHEDFVTIRRYLIEYGYMERTPDGKEYWIK